MLSHEFFLSSLLNIDPFSSLLVSYSLTVFAHIKTQKILFSHRVSNEMEGDFYLRYYVGHKGKFGHEFLEFEFRPDGKLRYANNSNYKNDTMIRKEACVHKAVMQELKRIIGEEKGGDSGGVY